MADRIDTLVPFSPDRPKTRLSDTLSPDERRAFADAMLTDVLEALDDAGFSPRLLTTEATDRAVPETVDDRPLTQAVNAAIDAHDPSPASPLAVVMADLALATPRALSGLLESGDVVLAAGRGGGTNALLTRHPDFHVDYHGASYRDHLRIAHDVGASVREVDSRLLATDIDERADLAEVLLSGDGAAYDWLRDAGFELDVGDGRVSVVREK